MHSTRNTRTPNGSYPFASFSPIFGFDTLFSPDGDAGGAATESVTGDGQTLGSAGSGTTATNNESSKDDKRKRDDASAAAKRDGMARERSAWVREIEAVNPSLIVRDTDGDIDAEATRAKFRDWSRSVTKGAKSDEEDEATRLVREANARATAAEARLQQIEIDAALTRAIPGTVFDADELRIILAAKYDFRLVDGEVRAYNKNNTRARRADGELASPADLVSEYLASKAHHVKAEHRSDGKVSADLTQGATADPAKMSAKEKAAFVDAQIAAINSNRR